MQIQDVFAAYRDDLQQIEKHLDKYITSDVKLIPEVSHHLIDSGGKRFRPLLLLISSRLCGYSGEDRFPLAAVIEFIHTASLLHDDVVDSAVLRRGRTSANNIWGNAASVLVGDFLYSKAFKLMSEIGNIAVIRLISKITNIMSEGEVFQLMKCGDADMTEEEYVSIIEKKTAVLISAACASGAILGSATQNKIVAMEQFGYRIGMAFQITDDTLDYMARQEDFGKSIGKDLEEGKMTLPLIYTLRQCTGAEKDRARELITSQDNNEQTVQEIFSLIHKYQGIDYSLRFAERLIGDARNILNVFADSPEKDQLQAVAEYILDRRI
jgi:octaprenyl-diphosphate synthase